MSNLNSTKKKIVLGIIIIVIILRIILVNTTLPSKLLGYLVNLDTDKKIDSFEDCVNADYTIMESYPRKCRTPDDRVFVEVICVEDSDCVVFGENGDCNCGCYTKNNLPKDSGGDCFCAAPKSCKCVEGKCESNFENY